MPREPILLCDGTLDLDAGTVVRGVAARALSPPELDVLRALVARRGETVDRADLAAAMGVEEARLVDSVVRRLRTKLEVDPARPRHLLTAYGAGYRFVGHTPEVRAGEAPPTVRLGPHLLDLAGRAVIVEGAPVRLTDKDVAVLGVLVERRGHAVSREELLRRVWGLRRPSALRYVDYVVHRLRQKLEVNPADPVLVRTVPGVGYLLDRVALAGDAPASPPRAVDALVGRAALLEEARRLLDERGRVALVGPMGIGKSRLAEELGPTVRVDLSAARSAADALAAVRRALEEEPGPATEGVVLLDDASAVAEHVPALVAALEPARVVVTTRVTPPVGPLLEVGPLDPADAVALFRARAALAPPCFDLDDPDERPLVADLTARLDGVPLAIGLAAARAGVLAPQQLLERIDVCHRDLHASVAWSWSLLDRAARAALARLAAWEGEFDADDVAALLDGPALTTLAALRAASWLLVRRADGGARYRLTGATRSFVRGLPDAEPDLAEGRRRHADRVLARAATALGEGFDFRAAVALRPIQADLHALLARADTPERHALAYVACACGAIYCGAAPPPGEPPPREGLPARLGALTAVAAASVLRRAGRVAEARAVLIDARGRLDAERHGALLGDVCWRLSRVAAQPREALQIAEEGVALLRRHGAPDQLSLALASVGTLRRHCGDPEGGEAAIREALALAQELGIAVVEAHARNELGLACLAWGRDDEGERQLRAALALYEAADHTWERITVSSNLGNVHHKRRDLPGARRAWEGGLALAEDARREVVPDLEINLGIVELEEGDLLAAERRGRRALSGHRRRGGNPADALGLLGVVALEEGRPPAAIELLTRAVEACEATGDAGRRGHYLLLRAIAAAEGGDLAGARADLAASRASIGPPPLPWQADMRFVAEVLVAGLGGERDPARERTAGALDSAFAVRWAASRVRRLPGATRPGT